MNEKIDKRLVALGVAIVIILSAIVLYSICIPARVGNDNRSAHDAMGQAQESAQRARERLDDTSNEIGESQEELNRGISGIDRATKRAGRIKEQSDQDAAELEQSECIVERSKERASEIERIINDIERANQEDRTQTDSAKKTA